MICFPPQKLILLRSFENQKYHSSCFTIRRKSCSDVRRIGNGSRSSNCQSAGFEPRLLMVGWGGDLNDEMKVLSCWQLCQLVTGEMVYCWQGHYKLVNGRIGCLAWHWWCWRGWHLLRDQMESWLAGKTEGKINGTFLLLIS